MSSVLLLTAWLIGTPPEGGRGAFDAPSTGGDGGQPAESVERRGAAAVRFDSPGGVAAPDGGSTAEAWKVKPGALGQTGAHLAFAAGVVGSSLLAVAFAYVPGNLYSMRTGRPEPLLTAGAMLGAGGIKVGITYFLLPELYRVGGGEPDLEVTRQRMWRLARWPALDGAVSLLFLILGAALERTEYGRGQYLLLGAFAALSASHTLFDILSIVGSSQGYRL